MSLAVLADHMASKGRGGDSMLIHMAPQEVAGLQALAMANGGSLTVNPDTGLPEALSLKKLLPALIGFGLNYFVPGLGSAVGSALGTSAAVGTGVAVGGFEALRTGDLGKGISAGIGAYGGAGLSEGLMAAGSTEAGLSSGALSAELAQAQGLPEGLSSGDAFNKFLTSDANPAVSEALKNASPFERMSAGFDAAKANPSSLLNKDNFKYMAAAAGPILADQAVTAKGPQTTTKPGMIRPYSFDPYGGTYTAGIPYETMPTKAADGGLMGMNDGGYAPGQLNFTQRSEPVVRMAEGGILKMAGGTPPAMLSDEQLYQKTGSWEAAAAARDQQNRALNIFNDAQRLSTATYVPPVGGLSNVKVNTQAEVDAANAENPYSAQNMAKVDVTRPGHYVNDASGNPVALTNYSPGFNINNPTALTYLGELSAGSSPDDAAKWFQQNATAAQKAEADRLWTAEKARLTALDVAAGRLPAENQGLAGLIPDSASYTNRFFAERGLGFDPIDKSIDNFLATYQNQLASMTPKQQEDAMRAALDKEKMNEADVIKATGKTIAQLIQQKTGDIDTVLSSALPSGVGGGGNTVVNANGTITSRPDIPNIPEGGFTGAKNVRDVYEEGGGSLGVNKNLFVPKTQDELFARYKNTGGSKAALDYLMGKAPYSPTPYTPTGEIQKPYWESVGRFPENRSTKKYVFVNGKYQLNPDYVKPSYVLAGEKAAADKAAAADKKTTGTTDLTNQDEKPTSDPGSGNEWLWDYASKKWYASPIQVAAAGGLMAMARGGMAQQFDLGGYSDGGRLLRGPGDGVSDSIPATIGNKRPARLADGEFVVPARIVSELGNGSTEAGARKLYAMMDRVQKARRGTVGKGRVAKNSRSDKYLPA